MTDHEFQVAVIDRLARIEERAEQAARTNAEQKASLNALHAEIAVIKLQNDTLKPLVTTKGLLQFIGVAVLAAAGAAGAAIFNWIMKQ